MDLNNPYDVLNAYFPGEITLRERFRPGSVPSVNFNLAEAAAYLSAFPNAIQTICVARSGSSLPNRIIAPFRSGAKIWTPGLSSIGCIASSSP